MQDSKAIPLTNAARGQDQRVYRLEEFKSRQAHKRVGTRDEEKMLVCIVFIMIFTIIDDQALYLRWRDQTSLPFVVSEQLQLL